MANVIAYAALDMISPEVWYGSLQEASSTRVVISNGYLTASYEGSGFTYSASHVIGGTLTTFKEYAGGALLGQASGFAISAPTVEGYVTNNDIRGLLSIIMVGADQIIGSTYSDQLAGFGGSDVLKGGLGFNTIDGGAGFDLALYDGSRNEFDIGRAGGSVTVDRHDGLVEDTLSSIERLTFNDGIVAFDQTAAQGYRLYQAAFDRTPDLGGISYWVDRLDGGTSLQDASANFIDSSEFRGLYGASPTSNEFVNLLYENVGTGLPIRAGMTIGSAAWTADCRGLACWSSSLKARRTR